MMEEQRIVDDIREMKDRLGRHSNRLQLLESAQLKESGELTQLKAEVRVMDSNIKAIKQSQEETQMEVSELKDDVNEIRGDIDKMQTNLTKQYRRLFFLVVALIGIIIYQDASSVQKILAAVQAIKTIVP